jgi:hypothetical protein
MGMADLFHDALRAAVHTPAEQRMNALEADNKAMTNALQRIEAGEGDPIEIATTTLNRPTHKELYG